MPIISASRNIGRSGAKRATSSSSRYVAAIIARCIDLVMKPHGGVKLESIPSKRPKGFGPRHIRFGPLPKPRILINRPLRKLRVRTQRPVGSCPRAPAPKCARGSNWSPSGPIRAKPVCKGSGPGRSNGRAEHSGGFFVCASWSCIACSSFCMAFRPAALSSTCCKYGSGGCPPRGRYKTNGAAVNSGGAVNHPSCLSSRPTDCRGSDQLAGFLEPEAHTARGSEVVAANIAVGDTAKRHRVHCANIPVPLRQEPPVKNQ